MGKVKQLPQDNDMLICEMQHKIDVLLLALKQSTAYLNWYFMHYEGIKLPDTNPVSLSISKAFRIIKEIKGE